MSRPMSPCRAFALPGGSPAPLLTPARALSREGLRATENHAVLYGSAEGWLRRELHGGVRPIASGDGARPCVDLRRSTVAAGAALGGAS